MNINYFSVSICLNFEYDLDNDLIEINKDNLDEVNRDIRSDIIKEFSSHSEIVDFDYDTDYPDNCAVVLNCWIGTTKSRDKIEDLINSIMSQFNNVKYTAELFDGTEYTEMHGFTYGPGEVWANSRDMRFTVYVESEIIDVKETDEDGNVINEAAEKNELEKRASYHRKHSKGLSSFPMPLTEYRVSNLQRALEQFIEFLVEFEEIYKFPEDKLLSDSWSDLLDGVKMGIDCEYECSEILIEYFEKHYEFNQKHPSIAEDDPMEYDFNTYYGRLKKEYNRSTAAYEAEQNDVDEAFDADKAQKRIACTTEFDNGYVLHNDYFNATSAEAEEKAKQASIENPDKVFYVKYDDVMNPSSDIKWKNGEQINEDKKNYKIQFYQIYAAPKSPSEHGKMIGQRDSFAEAKTFGEDHCGAGNFFIKAVCNDGKVRYIDNDFNESSKKKLVKDAGDVEHNVAMFNTMNNPSESPSTNPNGPMAEDYKELNEASRDQMIADLKAAGKTYYKYDKYTDAQIAMIWKKMHNKKKLEVEDEYDFKPEHKRCDKCNNYLNDMGTCPLCDEGDEDLYENVDEKNITKYYDELVKFFSNHPDKHVRYMCDEIDRSDDEIIIRIYDGDWKHEHLYCDVLVRDFFIDRGIGISTYTEEIGESDSDCYSSEHHYEFYRSIEPKEVEILKQARGV